VTHQFRRYLLQERELSTATLQNYIPFIDQFPSERFRNKTLNLSTPDSLTPGEPLGPPREELKG